MKYILILAVLFLIVSKFSYIMSFLQNVMATLTPVIMGFAIAYVVNLLMVKIERIWFPETHNRILNTMRRPVSMITAFLIIFFVVSFVFWLVLPQLFDAISQFATSIPKVVQDSNEWIQAKQSSNSQLTKMVKTLNIDIDAVTQNVINFFNGFSKKIMAGSVSFLAATATNTFNLILSLMLSFYILASKNRLKIQAKKLMSTYLPANHNSRIMHIIRVANDSFASFFAGEVIEAFILGILVTVGMFVCRLPYAGMIGALTGVLVLIPVLGAYLGAAVGFLMILTSSPSQAIFFLIFILIVQQLEGNFIYPKIVGNSIGLPGLWVLVAVTIGGGLFGIPGMLIGVPLAATAYKLLKEDVYKREPREL